MKKIAVQYTEEEHTTYIWVRPIPKPASGGHKALKNEDFIDHDDLMLRNSYYKQVVERNLTERYLRRVANPQTMTATEIAHNRAMGGGTRHSVPYVPNKPLYTIPRAN